MCVNFMAIIMMHKWAFFVCAKAMIWVNYQNILSAEKCVHNLRKQDSKDVISSGLTNISRPSGPHLLGSMFAQWVIIWWITTLFFALGSTLSLEPAGDSHSLSLCPAPCLWVCTYSLSKKKKKIFTQNASLTFTSFCIYNSSRFSRLGLRSHSGLISVSVLFAVHRRQPECVAGTQVPSGAGVGVSTVPAAHPWGRRVDALVASGWKGLEFRSKSVRDCERRMKLSGNRCRLCREQ